MIVRDKTEVRLRLRRVALDGDAEDGDLPFLIRQHPGEAFESGGFARAVVTEQTHDLPSLHLKGNAAHGVFRRTRIFFSQTDDFDGGRVSRDRRDLFPFHSDLVFIYMT